MNIDTTMVKYSIAADIYDEQNNIISNVGQGGQAFVRGIERKKYKLPGLKKGRPVSCFAHYQRTTTSEKNSTIYYS